jgi:hypothetical protein
MNLKFGSQMHFMKSNEFTASCYMDWNDVSYMMAVTLKAENLKCIALKL